ncbi:MAG TPA: serine/threonine-protein kinase, partial [Polyangiaceae bacterium]|nr:serine/threonine-protein kinase [Polyangiaceae bacterium]
VHRDVKPENLFLCEELDKSITLKVLDFGLARVIPGISSEAPQPLALPTETGAVLGTPRYLSPEAALGKRVDHRADLYALALVFYELVAGRGPFDDSAGDYLTAHTLEDPEPPSRHAKQPVPAEVDAAILRGLLKNPEERYQSAQEFQREVERLWGLIQNSQALETTVFSLEETGNRTASLRVRRDAPATAAVAPIVVPPRRTTRPALMVASVLVALITAAGITSLVAFFLSRTGP